MIRQPFARAPDGRQLSWNLRQRCSVPATTQLPAVVVRLQCGGGRGIAKLGGGSQAFRTKHCDGPGLSDDGPVVQEGEGQQQQQQRGGGVVEAATRSKGLSSGSNAPELRSQDETARRAPPVCEETWISRGDR